MSDFVVSARKYRPQTFDTVVGQHTITNTLKNAIKSEHLAQAFLFCGSRGVGKTTTARILAKTINCFHPTEQIEACDQCDSCLSFHTGNSLNIYELDAASNNSVDDIRNLIDQVRIAPQIGTHKIYIIDEVHMLSNSAFNAFLKTLEEPPKHAIFILATTEKHKIIPTILSRCQIFDFSRIRVKDIADHLAQIATKEGVSADPEALHQIAMKADGALRDALSIFDQIVTFAGTTLTYKDVLDNLNILDYEYYFKVMDAAEKEDISVSLLILNDVFEKGFDGQNFVVGLAEHLRNLLVCKDARTSNLLEVPETIRQRFVEQSKEIEATRIMRALTILSKTDVDYKSSKNQRLLIEVALMQLCSLKQESEKKKGLTDSVVILPFPTQTLRKSNASAPVNKPAVVASKPVVENVENKVLTSPQGVISTKHISIKDSIEKIKESQQQGNLEDQPREGFSIEHVKMYWKQYAYVVKENGLETFYNALIKRDPVLISEEVLGIVVDNQVQMDYIHAELVGFIEFMRKSLQNFHVDIQLSMSNEPEKETKFLTGKDKFNALARKNPNLHTLKNLFNLDIEY